MEGEKDEKSPNYNHRRERGGFTWQENADEDEIVRIALVWSETPSYSVTDVILITCANHHHSNTIAKSVLGFHRVRDMKWMDVFELI